MKIRHILLGIAATMAVTVSAQQQVQQMYFLENAPQRHYLNPAFQLYSNTYVSLPLIGNFQMGVENNSLRLSDLIYQRNGKVGYALSPGFDGRQDLFNALRENVSLNEDTRLEWLAFGHRCKKGGYFHVSFSTRVTSDLIAPRDLFRLGLYGMENDDQEVADSKTFKLSNLRMDASVYSEVAVGFSKPTKNDKWSIGGAVKALIGHDNVSMHSQDLTLETSLDQWVLNGTVDLQGAMPGRVWVDEDGKMQYDEGNTSDYQNYFRPKGYGAALDLGFAYRPAQWVEVSAAVTDLGGIFWTQDRQHVKAALDHITYSGVPAEDVTEETDFEELMNDEWDRIDAQLKCQEASKSNYFRMLNTHVNAAADFHTPNNLIGLGLLSTTKLMSGRLFEDITASVNLRPCNWFNLSVSHSLINLKQSCIGAGMALRGGPINLTVATDYVPLDYARTSASEKAYIPYKQKGLNVQVGLTLVFGNRKDADKDGVKDKLDECPNTPFGVKVDAKGCPLDEDMDSVPDYLDQCPGTPVGVVVDSLGCPLDEDGDRVPDYLDKCPGTPLGVQVDTVGCPVDQDQDGVADYLDRCPNTPLGVKVDSVGCPLDADLDGVPDYLDQCPGTPSGIRVDSVGCPVDTDHDGFPDDVDECPQVAGTDHGCPQVTKEVRNLFKKALHGIQFETGKSVIKPVSYPILDSIASVMQQNPSYQIEVQGHTDNTGNALLNKTLSQARAEAVKTYLEQKGVASERMTAVGYGQDRPVASNDTATGRAENRRVEFEVSFEEVHYETETIKE